MTVETRPLRRKLLIAAGSLCVALGTLGVFMPLLPTTPFLLLAASCYSRGSPRFYRWLLTNRCCGEYVRNYRAGRGIPLRQKVMTIILLWVSIAWSATLVPRLPVRVFLLAVAVGVTIHLLSIRTFRPAPPPADAVSPVEAGCP